jgi:hypothetical protein
MRNAPTKLTSERHRFHAASAPLRSNGLQVAHATNDQSPANCCRIEGDILIRLYTTSTIIHVPTGSDNSKEVAAHLQSIMTLGP